MNFPNAILSDQTYKTWYSTLKIYTAYYFLYGITSETSESL